MSKGNKRIFEYELNGRKYKTIEKLNNNGKRVWVKFEPIKPIQTVKVANILDRPQDVNWTYKKSHIEEIHPIVGKQNYSPAATAGSVCVPGGTFTILKEQDAQVILFPVDPINKCCFVDNIEIGSTLIGSVDTSTWIGYATTTGAITLLNHGSATLRSLRD